ncbi:MAG TPA: hypothetical protein VM658_22240 [bacterium]|nr:hypothetical protein [bacterium]
MIEGGSGVVFFPAGSYIYPDLDWDERTNLDEYVNGLDPAVCCPDQDDDGHRGRWCGGDDCDDHNPNAWNACETCRDNDQDSYFKLCDRYLTIMGPDCDDTDPTIFGCCPVLAGPELRVTYAPWYSKSPSLTWTGSEFAVSWQDARDYDYEIYFARISPAAEKIGPDLRVTSQEGFDGFSSLVFAGSEFGLIWQFDSLEFIRISASGPLLEPFSLITPGAEPSLAWTGSEFGLAFCGGWPYEIYFVRFSPGGVVIGPELRITYNGFWGRHPQLVWTGSEFGLSWHDFEEPAYDLWFTRISSDGLKIGPDLYVPFPRGKGANSSLRWTGSEFGIAWNDTRDGNPEIYFARISAQGSKLGPDLRVTYDGAHSLNPSLAWSGDEFGLSWQDDREGTDQIYFAKISSQGLKMSKDFPVRIGSCRSSNPALAWSGSEFGVSWQDYYYCWDEVNDEIYFARIGCAP